MISGLGAPCFEQAVQELLALTEQFGRFFEPGEWAGWTPPTTAEGFLALEANCRYLSPARSILSGTDIPFTSMEDPHGHLERSKDASHIRTDNNVVEFYRRNPVDQR